MTEGNDPSSQPLMGHLDELRSRLIKTFIAIGVGTVIAFFFRNQMLALLQDSYSNTAGRSLVVTGPTDQFSIAMRMSIFGGSVLASPVIAYQAWSFINPGLTNRERRWAIPVVAALVTLFSVGVAFAYWSLPRAVDFLVSIFSDLENLWTVELYTRFVIRFLLLFGISFQFPVFIFGAAAAGVVTSARLAAGRRWAVVIIVVVGAVVSPTGDPVTLILLSTPLYLLYEGTIWLIRLTLRK
ncbi:MAG: twin-arginine translocase subunit TatC [bacterium]|nr:twin-arginine translocase subunit TatC [bacterium]MCY3579700.1 twin-arginine translocase subunit TatC [bacterium]MCY3652524.1 twin-arginine translocase subunit TatC [bacterium]MXX64739.1 twin-arginine translocase subunit TatC [Acidimicrobiia bacterium]MYD05070.1 twin-arginine translocase subunit TatC [Acidimicrobiia bacterium]